MSEDDDETRQASLFEPFEDDDQAVLEELDEDETADGDDG